MLCQNSPVCSPLAAHGQQPLQPNEFSVLHDSYLAYQGALADPCFDTSKSRLNALSDQLLAKGVYGNNALQLLQKYSSHINWQGMSPDMFSSFYRFVYFICREPNKRNVQVATAVAAWRLVLCGRFRLLDRWCSYVSAHHKANVVLEDTWRQVLDFSRTVHEDLSNYDPASAWPVLLDEFVEYVKSQRHPNRPCSVCVPMEPLDMLCPWSVRPMTAVSPRSGSKRRPPDVLEVADQLQQLPLGSQNGAAAGAAAAGAAASPASQRARLAAKRLRLGNTAGAMHSGDSSSNAAAMQAGLAAPASLAGGVDGVWPPAAVASNEPPTAVFAGGSAAGDDNAAQRGRRVVGGVGGASPAPEQLAAGGSHCQQPMQQHQQHQQVFGLGFGSSVQPPGTMGPPAPLVVSSMNSGSSGAGQQLPDGQGSSLLAPTGLIFRENGLGAAAAGGAAGFGQQQQQIGSIANNSHDGSSMDVSMDQTQQQHQQLETRQQQQQQHQQQHFPPGLNLQHQQQHQQQSATAPPPPCPSSGHSYHHGSRFDAESMKRTNSVIAMMQVTVTEALGFN